MIYLVITHKKVSGLVISVYVMNNESGIHAAYGYLGCDGRMCVKTNKNIVTKKNKPYNTD